MYSTLSHHDLARRKGIGGDGDADKKKSQSSVPPPPKEQPSDSSSSPFALDKIGGLDAAVLKHEEGREGSGDWSD